MEEDLVDIELRIWKRKRFWNMYWKEEKSLGDIAKIEGEAVETIRKFFNRNDIKVRSRKQAMRIKWKGWKKNGSKKITQMPKLQEEQAQKEQIDRELLV